MGRHFVGPGFQPAAGHPPGAHGGKTQRPEKFQTPRALTVLCCTTTIAAFPIGTRPDNSGVSGTRSYPAESTTPGAACSGRPALGVALASARLQPFIAFWPGAYRARGKSGSITFVRWISSVGEGVPLPRPRIRVVHGTVPQKCACNTLPARSGILYRAALEELRCRPLPTSSTRAPEVTPN
jgi:hypothetical protein